VRVGLNTGPEAIKAIANAKSGPVQQGSVGAGTGMTTFDFAGGIGSASRVLPKDEGGHTVGVLVMSNFGKMRNLTIDGKVVGRELDPLFPYEGRRENSDGSVIVVLATDAPLLSSQLNRLAKRAALGLGRTGSLAAASSGEIIIAFSTKNRTARRPSTPEKTLTLKFISDRYINGLYEAVIEATEEAVINAIFSSAGMKGRQSRSSPALPVEEVISMIVNKGR
jgi:L-aminopeptidase/D-esterase-like protein